MITEKEWKEFLDWRNAEYDKVIKEEYNSFYPDPPPKKKRKFLFWSWEYQPKTKHNLLFRCCLAGRMPKVTVENYLMWRLNNSLTDSDKKYKYEEIGL